MYTTIQIDVFPIVTEISRCLGGSFPGC